MQWKVSESSFGHALLEIEMTGRQNSGRDLGLSSVLVVSEALGMGESAQGEKME